MNRQQFWVVISQHLNPSDFYVKVDGADSYTGFWITKASSVGVATRLVDEVSKELMLGETQVISGLIYREGCSLDDLDVSSRIDDNKRKLIGDTDVQLAAWMSSRGSVW